VGVDGVALCRALQWAINVSKVTVRHVKRPAKEACKRDLQKRPAKETCKRYLWRVGVDGVALCRALQWAINVSKVTVRHVKRPAKEACKKGLQKIPSACAS